MTPNKTSIKITFTIPVDPLVIHGMVTMEHQANKLVIINHAGERRCIDTKYILHTVEFPNPNYNK